MRRRPLCWKKGAIPKADEHHRELPQGAKAPRQHRPAAVATANHSFCALGVAHLPPPRCVQDFVSCEGNGPLPGVLPLPRLSGLSPTRVNLPPPSVIRFPLASSKASLWVRSTLPGPCEPLRLLTHIPSDRRNTVRPLSLLIDLVHLNRSFDPYYHPWPAESTSSAGRQHNARAGARTIGLIACRWCRLRQERGLLVAFPLPALGIVCAQRTHSAFSRQGRSACCGMPRAAVALRPCPMWRRHRTIRRTCHGRMELAGAMPAGPIPLTCATSPGIDPLGGTSLCLSTGSGGESVGSGTPDQPGIA